MKAKGTTRGRVASGIKGVGRTSLWSAWKVIRKNLHRSSIRDVVDFLDHDVDPDVWINRLIKELRSESYEPRKPERFPLAKSKGFSRTMTLPSIPDLVLYRAIVDYCYDRAIRGRREGKHVYFEQAVLSKVQSEVSAEARNDLRREAAQYGWTTRSRFAAWLRYDEYRRYLILKKIYNFIIVTDITNYFDSILYKPIADSLAPVSDSRIVGLLFFLLERLSIRAAYSESPRVGLPVDEFDCSRKLAHSPDPIPWTV